MTRGLNGEGIVKLRKGEVLTIDRPIRRNAHEAICDVLLWCELDALAD
jgi:hypothetical protein